jgi:OPA family glycerol-3-phosphate transporter-like MFS transporter
MIGAIKKFFDIPVAQPLMSQSAQKKAYARYRKEVFLSIFLGYAGYYLVRKNLALVAPDLAERYHYDMRQIGLMMGAISFSYGISKFLMGAVSDRSNAKVFLSFGLFFSALITTFVGFFPNWIFQHFFILVLLMGFNGWFQGMGWPPCGRIMVHWFSHPERGAKMAIWNMAHNIGQALPAVFLSLGMTYYLGWNAIIWLPGLIALALSLFIYQFMQDTPQSVGLPTIEKFQGMENLPSDEIKKISKNDFFEYILKNKYLWALAIANLFVYLTRYAVIDWLPIYLVQERGYSQEKAGICYSLYEIAGIGGTFICGWLSDRFFDGRRAPVGILFLFVVTVTLICYWTLPNEYTLAIDMCLFALGFLIYGPVMLIGLHAIDMVPKHVAGTAAGFTGLFGYVGGATCANAAFGYIVYYFGWDGGFVLLLASCFIAIIFLSFTLNIKTVSKNNSLSKKEFSTKVGSFVKA